jgi:ABC-type multidrug transport system fused ATPase/permease subunit
MLISRVKEHFKIFKKYIIPFKGKFILILSLILVLAVLSLIPPLFLKYLLDDVFVNKDFSALYLIIGAFFIVQLLSSGIKVFMEYWHEYVGAWMIFKIRNDLFRHLQNLSVNFFQNTKHGDILTRLRSDVTSIHAIISIVLTSTLPDITQIVGILCILFYLNWGLTLLSLIMIPVFFFSLSFFGKKIKFLARKARDKDAIITNLFVEVINNIPVVKIFNTQEYELTRHEKRSTDYIQTVLKMQITKFISVFVIGMVTSISIMIVLGMGGYFVMTNSLTIGGFVAFYTYMIRLFAPLQRVANYNVSIYSSLASVDRVKELLETKPEIADIPEPIILKNVKGKISFCDVNFKHPYKKNPKKENYILQNISFDINPGEHIAIVGKTGSGKTTIINLLCRLYSPQKGSVKIDDIDIKNVSETSLYKNISIVPQNDMLFNESVDENIRYGNPGSSDSLIHNYVKAIGLDTIIAKMENRIKTNIGPQGSRLSGGERKILMIARALIKNTPIIIFDEATSAIDMKSEEMIFQNLGQLMKDKTVITIAHRYSSIINADKVLVLDQGRIVGVGTHSELLKNNHIYQVLFNENFKTKDDQLSYA